MTHVTGRLTAKNRDQLRNATLGNRVRATCTLFTCVYVIPHSERQSDLLFHGAGEHLDALHVDGSLDALLELLVLASFPAHADEAAAARDDDHQRRHSDTDRTRVADCTCQHARHMCTVKYTDIAKFAGHLPHRYGNSRAIWDHTVLPATRQR